MKMEKYITSFPFVGIYDVPASIDYVLQETNHKKLQYVAHSQGATAFFVMLSERPEYNDKIEMMHALAPAVFLSHSKSPLIRAIVPFISVVRVCMTVQCSYYFLILFI